MKFYASFIILFSLFGLHSCDKNLSAGCQQISLGQPFTAKIDEAWCIGATDWKIKFGPFIEDSRCNVADIDCVWAGRYVMGVAIDEHGESVQDTFYAEYNWTDTIYHGAYKVILSKVYPEVRTSMEPLEPSAYSFEIIVKQ